MQKIRSALSLFKLTCRRSHQVAAHYFASTDQKSHKPVQAQFVVSNVNAFAAVGTATL
jgi:hypothetical protein